MPRFLLCILSVFALCGSASLADAQSWPSKSVRIIVPHPPGGPADVPPRGMAQSLSQTLGQPFVIENRDGADGMIGAEACARAAPDGYTLCATSSTVITLNPEIRLKLPYDPPKDFTPVIYFGVVYGAILTHPSVTAKTMRELVNMAKAKPDSITWGTLGGTSVGPVFMGWFKNNLGVSFYQIPYKSTTQALQATVAGDVNMVAYALGPAVPLIRAGKLRALAVIGGDRSPLLPDVPSLKEAGYEVDLPTWFGMFAPAGTPVEIINRLNAEIAKLILDPQFRAKFLTTQGIERNAVTAASPEKFAEYIQADREMVTKILRIAGIQKQ
jgi:tripartite-type tricarboxylate transporter receptor subunit TctC